MASKIARQAIAAIVRRLNPATAGVPTNQRFSILSIVKRDPLVVALVSIVFLPGSDTASMCQGR